MIALIVACCGNQHPTMAAQSSDSDYRLAGHVDEGYGCYVDATADGAQFQVFIDAGWDGLAFNRSHLRKLGLSAKQRVFSVTVHTSSGTMQSAQMIESKTMFRTDISTLPLLAAQQAGAPKCGSTANRAGCSNGAASNNRNAGAEYTLQPHNSNQIAPGENSTVGAVKAQPRPSSPDALSAL